MCNSNCQARQHSDQMLCEKCGTAWDMKDPNPPACKDRPPCAALTEEDISSAAYFIKEKGDITRWSNWEEKKPLFMRQHPGLIAALSRVEFAERELSQIINAMEDSL